MVPRTLEVPILAAGGHLEQKLLKGLDWAATAERLAEDLSVLLLGRSAVACGADLQLAHDIALYVSDKKLRHVIAMIASGKIAAHESAARIEEKPGTRLELVTPSLPWKCSTN